jgi:hypothetical protein
MGFQPSVLCFEFVDTTKLHQPDYQFPVFVGAEVLIPQHNGMSLNKKVKLGND